MVAQTKKDTRPKYFSDIQNAISNKKLVIVVGTGVSRALSANSANVFSWSGLIQNGLEYCKTRACVTDAQYGAWKTHLDSSDIDDLLSAAEFVGRKLGAPTGSMYARWLEESFGAADVLNKGLSDAISSIAQLEIPIATLNYDTLLEEVTGLPTINFSETKKVTEWVRRETSGILHLHGVWSDPQSCILGIRDYHTASLSDVRQFIQRNLSTFGRILFLGCGDTFSDPNFSALISWMRAEIRGSSPLHYALVRESELSTRHADANWQGFVEPISYGKEYSDLPTYLKSLLPSPEVLEYISKSQPPSTENQVRDDKALREYRSFLLRDCGQMTIEGIRTDIDTAQRKFDLEKLFVPLSVTPIPPEFPLSDKKRDVKLRKWMEENNKQLGFGEIFTNQQRIALLALPGGGKTLLLKRLAVAYADENRRTNSNDFLPDLDIYPVLIRCREWREHIARPIPFILKNISNITGQSGLDNFYEALLPLLKAGKVVLLVDGLDEIHSDADRATFAENLEKFLDDFKKIRLVVTSREAGFGLVAPTVARFCDRWRLAPLDDVTISSLCVHWHKLMAGESVEAADDAAEVSERLLQNPALRRLAENPLLLTMLLVVKHGAGRLPPDRVSLYSRAVEVLLDTWNIKGHEALNIKEALPQLSYVAYELMRRGKQTATQSELISLLEEAREKVPRIKMYAKDSPVDFLRRVELRSSLLMEAGYQLEGSRPVPFYQFRHLTFQEYLAAEAAVNGNYREYSIGDNLLTPLASCLELEEWKEVIPMATVLARRQAEPVMIELLNKAKALADDLKHGVDFEGKRDWSSMRLPSPVSLLLQCLAEEAEASPQTLTDALYILAVFAKGCRSNANWDSLLKGIYSDEFINVIFEINPAEWPTEIWLRNTKAVALALSKAGGFWRSNDGMALIHSQLNSNNDSEIERGLLALAGVYWGHLYNFDMDDETLNMVEQHIFSASPRVWEPAIWVFGLAHSHDENDRPCNIKTLDRLAEILIADGTENEVASFALSRLAKIDRANWSPKVDADGRKKILEQIDPTKIASTNFSREPGYFILAYHIPDLIDDGDLYSRLKGVENVPFPKSVIEIISELENKLLVPQDYRMSPRPARTRRKVRSK
ncbi:hypothetical protein FHX06_001458 [Rhizobium sp. BK512]|uniref:SIR2 family protein n=1 Tax=Rhizobium sp. BK512 TaxID=2587010 RepID=UPI001618D7F8|nr:SIR2 family protein [Rhizobium sp. BK512]MBB3560147.1 hypothetical protein [Rhizobium sp. BK512]